MGLRIYLGTRKLRVFYHLLHQILRRLTALDGPAGSSALRHQSAFELFRGLGGLVRLKALYFLLHGFIFLDICSQYTHFFVFMLLEVEAKSTTETA